MRRRPRILAFHDLYPLEGYRRLAYMMLDADIVAVSPSSVYRVLKAAGKLAPRGGTPSRKGKGFEQPLRPHEHWHVDVSHLNICGTFFFLCSILDGYSRLVVHWEIRETMKEAEVEIILQRASEQYPGEHPRIITDNGPQFIARDFKEFIRICGMTHVKTSPYYPQSKGYASSCTSFVFSGETLGSRRESVSLRPCRLSGPFGPTGSYRYSCLSL